MHAMHDDGPAGQSRSKVSATTEALTMIERLSVKHGSLAFFQSGGCCDGSLPICLPDGAMPAGPGDEMLGMVGGDPAIAHFACTGRQPGEEDRPIEQPQPAERSRTLVNR